MFPNSDLALSGRLESERDPRHIAFAAVPVATPFVTLFRTFVAFLPASVFRNGEE
jgi:hypothetical protein